LGDESIRDTAIRLGEFIRNEFIKDKVLWHSYKDGKTTILGFLEDYAAICEGLLGLYQITFDESWLFLTEKLLDETIQSYYDEEDGFFYFTHREAESLIARKKELMDNVIPSSNSIMASTLYQAGLLLDRLDFQDKADAMLHKIDRILGTDIQVATNWAAFYAQRVAPTAEIAIVGPQSDEFRKDLDRFFIPSKVVTGTETSSNLPLLADRDAIDTQTTIYVCFNKACQMPVHTVKEALAQLP
jgi:hypothetical protein